MAGTLDRRNLSEAQAADLLVALTDPTLAPALGGALLAGLRAKGVTADEVRGFAKTMRRLARRPILPDGGPLVDMVGTGGDGSGSFNLSTGAALLVAAMGIRVRVHPGKLDCRQLRRRNAAGLRAQSNPVVRGYRGANDWHCVRYRCLVRAGPRGRCPNRHVRTRQPSCAGARAGRIRRCPNAAPSPATGSAPARGRCYRARRSARSISG